MITAGGTVPGTSPARPEPDARIWRAVGDPLVEPSGSGALDGETVAVKDLFAIAGHPIGAGNPAWLAAAATEKAHAHAVAALLDAGASVRGIAQTDEFAYSLMGSTTTTGLRRTRGRPAVSAVGRRPGQPQRSPQGR
ncbi:hypothetical protein Prum_102770 [Phytohabitans rumicis]|uniref:Amidase domain-containing protein n=1 Tax=Phytohabitans rumicis TaxID=1076125 RepID=A0A6V8LV31_9ACTN|nr:hypothetical protein Prum_102770 [Phytohabitans rumicis]